MHMSARLACSGWQIQPAGIGINQTEDKMLQTKLAYIPELFPLFPPFYNPVSAPQSKEAFDPVEFLPPLLQDKSFTQSSSCLEVCNADSGEI